MEIHREEDGRVVGQVVGSSYITERTPEHYFRMFDGFGLDYTILKKLAAYGVRHIIIFYKDKDKTTKYASPVDIWFLHGKIYRWMDVDQVILPVKFMEKD